LVYGASPARTKIHQWWDFPQKLVIVFAHLGTFAVGATSSARQPASDLGAIAFAFPATFPVGA